MPDTNKPLKKYRVLKREIWVQAVEIEATTEEEAISRVGKGEGEVDEDGFEYSHDHNKDLWTVEDSES